MADYTQYHALGQGMGADPNDPNRSNPYAHQPPPPPPPPGYGGMPPPPHGFPAGSPQPPADDALAAQMGGMNLGAPQGHGTVRRKKKDRHAYHTVEPTGSSQAFNGMPPPGSTPNHFIPTAAAPAGPGLGAFGAQPLSPHMAGSGQFPAPAGVPFGSPSPGGFVAGNGSADAAATIAPAGPSKISLDDMPSVPLSRDSAHQYFLKNIYPTLERHVPPPAAVSFAALDQGNASPKYARLTMNNIPATADGLQATGLPLGLLLQPLAPLQSVEAGVPVLDFGEAGPPRCRRCRAYINPFMIFRSGGNKFVCNLCTYPNDTPPEYFCATSPQGVRLDSDQRPELRRGTVEFVVPKEYWTREPVAMRWLFAIDATQESYNRGFMETFCDGILAALYGGGGGDDDQDAEKRRIPEGAKVGFLTFDKDVHFYNLDVSGAPTARAATRVAGADRRTAASPGPGSDDDYAGPRGSLSAAWRGPLCRPLRRQGSHHLPAHPPARHVLDGEEPGARTAGHAELGPGGAGEDGRQGGVLVLVAADVGAGPPVYARRRQPPGRRDGQEAVHDGAPGLEEGGREDGRLGRRRRLFPRGAVGRLPGHCHDW